MADVVGRPNRGAAQEASQPRNPIPQPTISLLRSRNQYPKLIAELKKCSEAEQVGRLRNLCRTDLFFLLRYGCGRADVEKDWVFDRSREVQADPHGHLDLWAREHFKSSLITFGLTIQEILASHGDDPLIDGELTFGIFSHTRPIAKAFLRQIKVEFETNERLKLWFADILWADPRKQALKWSEDEGIIVQRKSNPKEATVEAWGLVDGQPTSKHYRRMVYDDVVTRESVTTPEMIKKTTEAWELSRNLAAEGGESRYIGTRYHFLDTYRTLVERGIKARVYPATIDGTASGEPVLMSRETLAKKRVEMASTFNSQMLQNPSPDEDAYFKKEWFRWYDVAPKHLSKYGASDFAVTTKGGDFTVHAVVGIDLDDNLYVLDIWRKQTTTDVWIDQLIGLMKQHKPMLWAAPADQIKRSVGPFLTKRMAETKTYVAIQEMSDAGDKPAKARSFQGRMATGKVYFPKRAEWLDDLVLEMSMFPVGHDDQVDALGLIGRMLDEMIGGRAPAPGLEPDNRDDYRSYDRSEVDAENDWKTI